MIPTMPQALVAMLVGGLLVFAGYLVGRRRA